MLKTSTFPKLWNICRCLALQLLKNRLYLSKSIFILCKNDRDFNERPDSVTVLESVSSSSMTNLSVCCANKLAGCSLTKRDSSKKKSVLTSNSIRMRTTTRNLEMKAKNAILYDGQLERWTSNLRRKLLVLVVCVFVDLDHSPLHLLFSSGMSLYV